MTITTRLHLLPLLVFSSLLAACGGDDLSATGYACVADESLIAERAPCARDVDCPCGTHCSYGLCQYDCRVSGHCEGGWCDALGRCRDKSDRAATPPVQTANKGVLAIANPRVMVYSWSPEGEFEVSAQRGELDGVRVVAPEGIEVSCGVTFAQTCSLLKLNQGATAKVAVKLDAEALYGEETRWTIKLHHHQQLQTVVVTLSGAQGAVTAPVGRYEGHIWLSKTSAEMLGDTPLKMHSISTRASLFAVPVELKIYADDTLVITDKRKMLPRASDKVGMVFKLRPDHTFDAIVDSVDKSRQLYYGGAVDEDDTTAPEVSVLASGKIRATPASLAGELELTLGGMGDTFFSTINIDERPRVSWQFHVKRQGDIITGDDPPAIGSAPAPIFASYAVRDTHNLPWEAEVRACGAFGGTDRLSQLAHYLCYNHPGDLSSVDLAPAAHVDDLSATGDLKCSGATPRPTIFPLFTAAERSITRTPGALLSGCIKDLQRVHGPVEGDPQNCDATALDQISGCGSDGCTSEEMPTCIDGPLALAAIGFGLETVSLQGHPDLLHWPVDSDGAARLTHRMIQQWLQVHTFVAREATQQSSSFSGKDMSDLATALDLSLKGWDAFFHPKLVARLMHFPASVLALPDYRDVSEGTDKASVDRTQAVGMPVVLMETVKAQLEASRQLVERARFEGKTLPPAVDKALLAATLATSVAQAIYAKVSSEGAPFWAPLWGDAQAGATQTLRSLLREIDAYEAGENPLGITDNDLPLYRGLVDHSVAGQRFSAVSRYLLETFAQPSVDTALASETASKAAWEALLNQELQKVVKDDQPDRVAEIKRQYGEKILNLCGDNSEVGDASQVFDNWPGLSPQNCFINTADTSCTFDDQQLLDRLSTDDIQHHICVMGQLQAKLGDKARLQSEDVNKIMQKAAEKFHPRQEKNNEFPYEYFVPESFVEWGSDLYTMFKEGEHPMSSMYQLENYPDARPEDEQAFFDARSLCDKLFPKGKPIEQKFTAEESFKPHCFRGAIGELALQARAASKDVEIANSALQDYTDAYEKAINRCVMAEEALKMNEHAQKQFKGIVSKIQKQTSVLHAGVGILSSVAGTVANLVTCGLLKDAGSAKKVAETTSSSLVSGTVDFIGGTALNVIDNELLGLGDAQDAHAAFVSDFSKEITRTLCFADAEMHLVGADTQLKRVQRSKIDLTQAIVKMQNAKRTVARLMTEAHRRVKHTQGRERASLFNNIWNDLWEGKKEDHRGAVVDHAKNMRLAQRMLYLAVRAVEYEWQVTSTFRAQVLAATTPAQLKTVLDAIKTEIATGNIGGQSPEDRHAELSLRDQLMQLADRTEWPDGYHKMTPTERFRMMLTDRRYAHFSAQGEYLGQLVPFTIAPLGVLGLGEAGAIPLLTGAECAEKLWSVNMTLHGEKLVDGDQGYVSIQLLQKNTFYSQWCSTPTAGQSELQMSSVRPSRNLFKDPVLGGTFGSSNTDDSEYLRALVDAYFNVSREELEKDYTLGASNELASRGLYGEYAIFFPKEQLAVDGKKGLHLERIDDILLRIDYVSAAKAW